MSSNSLNDLIDEFSRMPSIGRKTARRLAFYVLDMKKHDAVRLADTIVKVKEKIRYCNVCGYITEEELCIFCRDVKREQTKICVVENLTDVIAIEKTGSFKGLYHILGGLISPLDGLGPKDLRIKQLHQRAIENKIQEILLAIPHSIKGDTTVLYIQQLFKDSGITISRIAAGIPFGSDLEYADMMTLSKSIQGRTSIK